MESKISSMFTNFDDEKLDIKRDNGIIYADQSQASFIQLEGEVPKFKLKGTPIYVKCQYRGGVSEAIFEIVTSKIMNKCGVNSAPYFPVILDRNNLPPMFCAFSQDLNSLKDIEIRPGDDLDFWFDAIVTRKCLRNNPWFFVEDNGVKSFLLRYMTQECFDQLIDECLIDLLMGQTDRNFKNFYFYKSKDEKKYEGLINIDNALTWIFRNGYNMIEIKNDTKWLKEIGLHSKFMRNTVGGDLINQSYSETIAKILDLFDKGILGQRQAQLIKTYLEYDIVSMLKQEANRCNKTIDRPVIELYSIISQYLENNLQRQL